MWIGPGGVMALVVAVWGCVWAAGRTEGWQRWMPRGLGFLAAVWNLPVVTSASVLLSRETVLSRSESREEGVELVLKGAYEPFGALGVATAFLLLAFALGARRCGASEQPAGRVELGLASLALAGSIGAGACLALSHLAPMLIATLGLRGAGTLLQLLSLVVGWLVLLLVGGWSLGVGLRGLRGR
jgi:hypothetical protein